MLKWAALATLLALILCLSSTAALGNNPKPPTDQYARVARWLVHAASWGTLSTISAHLKGAPYGCAPCCWRHTVCTYTRAIITKHCLLRQKCGELCCRSNGAAAVLSYSL